MAGTGTAGPGRGGPPPNPKDEQRSVVARMAHVIASDVAHLEQRTIDRLLPVLLEARTELLDGLTEILAENGDARYTAQAHRRALSSLQAAIDQFAQMRPDIQAELEASSHAAATLAVGHIREELARFGAVFGYTLGPTQISTAALIKDTRHEIIPRIRTSAARYVEAVREDIRHQLALGLVKGETFTQLTNRLRALGGPRGMVSLRGVAGEPGAQVEHIAEGLFNRYRHWAERVVRTEVMNAYSVQHVAGIEQINAERAEDEEPLQLKWDASPDKRVCVLCAAMDGKTAKVGGTFPGGVDHPPLHPNCRCVAVAWHPSWGSIHGENKPKPPEASEPHAVRELAAGKLKAARVHLDDALDEYGLARKPSTNLRAATEVVTTLPAGVQAAHDGPSGIVRLSPEVRDGARAFAKAYEDDPVAVRRAFAAGDPATEEQVRAFHILVHELGHGFGPATPAQIHHVHGTVDEVATELAARAFVRDRFRIKTREPEYQPAIDQATAAIRTHYGFNAKKASKVLEEAALAYKRMPEAPGNEKPKPLLRLLAERIHEVAGRPSKSVDQLTLLLSSHLRPPGVR